MSMSRVARNHDVSRQNCRLDYRVLFLQGCATTSSRFFSHMGGVLVEREEP
jgi:hypothetical protein